MKDNGNKPLTIAEHFDVLEDVGSGGSAIVYRVVDKISKKIYALKLFRKVPTPSEYIRFAHEFNTLTTLRHPYIVTVYDFGESQDGRPYFTMDLFEGKRIDKSVRGYSSLLLKFLSQIFFALDYLHSSGFIHGDLKPSNILVGKEINEDVVCLTDFGLVQKLDLESHEVRGTIGYIAPEVLHGFHYSPQSDLYSVGCVIYELITGRKPFEGESTLSIIKKAQNDVPIPIGELGVSVPPLFEELLHRLLARHPQDRYSDAKECLSVLSLIEPIEKGFWIKKMQPLPSHFDFRACRLIGRKKEMEFILSKYENFKKEGVGSIICISGKEGMGKSRLLLEFKLHSQLERVKTTLLMPLSEKEEEGKTPALLREIFQKTGMSDSDITDFEKIDLSANAQAERKTYFERVLGLFKKNKVNAIFLIEDLQDFDEGSYEFFKYLIQDSIAGGEVPLFIIGTHRGALELSDMKEEIMLTELSTPEINEFIKSILPGFSSSEELSKWIEENVGGNPRLIEEVLNIVNREGGIFYEDGTWNLSLEKLEGIKLSKKVEEIISLRIKEFSEKEKEILSFASVISIASPSGFFHLGLLESVFEIIYMSEDFQQIRLEKDETFTILRNLEREGILQCDEGISYRFSMKAMRDVLLETVPEYKKKKIHHWSARLLSGERFKEICTPSLLATHFYSAEEWEDAYKNLILAGDLTKENFSYRESISHFKKALILIDDGKVSVNENEKVSLCESLGDLLKTIGETKNSLEFYKRAILTKDLKKKILLNWKTADTYQILGDYESALNLLSESLEIGKKFNIRGEEIVKTLNMKGWIEHIKGESERAEETLISAENLALEIEDDSGLSQSLSFKAGILEAKGNYDSALNLCLKSVEIAEKLKDYLRLANSSISAGILFWRKGALNSAEEWFRKALSANEKFCDIEVFTSIYGNLSLISISKEKWREAEELLKKSIFYSKKSENKFMLANAETNLAWVYMNTGEYKRALPQAEDAVKIARENKFLNVLSDRLDTLGIIYHRLGEWEKAESAFKEATSEGMENIDRNGFINSIISYGFLEIDRGNFECAYEKFTDKRLSETENIRILRGKALSLSGMGKEEARSIADSALKRAKESEDKKEIALCERALGIVRLCRKNIKDDEIERAIIHLENSVKILREESEPYELLKSILEFVKSKHRYGIVDKDLISFCTECEEIAERLSCERELNTIRIIEASILREIAEKRFVLRDRERSHLSTLYQISSILSALTQERETFFEKVLDSVIDLLSAERGIIFLIDEDTGKLRVAKGRGVDKSTIEDATLLSLQTAEKVKERGVVVLSKNALEDERFSKQESVILNKILSLLCVPLVVRNKVIGALYLDSRLIKSLFTEEDREFVLGVSSLVASAIEKSQLYNELQNENIALKREITKEEGIEGLIGESQKMKTLFDDIIKVANSDTTVLIEGESGTGKEIVAKAIYSNSSRKKNIFLAVDCGALTETLLESELFGHIKGSFTGAYSDKKGLLEVADGGTVFLDEVSSSSSGVQAKLLRFLQEGEIRAVGSTDSKKVDVRIICATNKDLEKEVRDGKFRSDLYYRLRVAHIKIPPLREREDDILLLANHFLKKYNAKLKKKVRGFDRDVLNLFLKYPWHGNVRELEHTVERACLKSTGAKIVLADIDLKYEEYKDKGLKDTVRDEEKKRIEETLALTNGNVKRASERLNINRSHLHRLLKKYKIKPKSFKVKKSKENL